MKKTIYAYDVVIEVGRKCNLCCAHCLRGPAEDKTVDVETAKKFLSEFSSIESLIFTGGEPCLYADEIISIIDYVIEQKIQVNGCYIASNGTIKSPALMMKLVEFRAYCSDCYGGYDDDTEYAFRFDVSNDMFHDGYENNLRWFSGFSFVGTRNNVNGADTSGMLISEGRAEEYGMGTRTLDKSKGFDIEESNATAVNVTIVYLNAEGYVLPDCDYSYQTQREIKPFKYGSMPLDRIIETYNVSVSEVA